MQLLLDTLAALALALAVNAAPPTVAMLLGERFAHPLDFGATWRDGKPLLGPHKTWRGLMSSVLAGGFGGWLLGFGFGAGLLAGLGAMVGDVCTSFAKRRLSRTSGTEMPALDQFLEGALPLAVLYADGDLSPAATLVACMLFVPVALVLSRFSLRLKTLSASHLTAWREWSSCAPMGRLTTLFINLKTILLYKVGVPLGLGSIGLLNHGKARALDVAVTRLEFTFDNLPPAFDGYALAFVSDLHLDGLDGLTERLIELLHDNPADILVLGGDYRYKTYGPWDTALERLSRLCAAVNPPDGKFAVLGNHDCADMVPELRAMGLTVFLNDRVEIRRGESRIHLAGLDDPHYFRRADARQALAGVPPGEFTAVVAHAPEGAIQAVTMGAELFLCGHTHDGQIRLPVVGAPVSHSRAPKQLLYGRWRLGTMQGYTSTGAGVSGAPVRLGTRGEVVMVKLKLSRERDVP